MAELDLTAIAASSMKTPAAGVGSLFFDSTTKQFTGLDDTGAINTIRKNQSLAAVVGYAADTYLVGSSFLIPPAHWRVGMRYHVKFDVTKTAAGVAAAQLRLRLGLAGAVTDAAIDSGGFIFNAQTAVVDSGIFELDYIVRTIGAGALGTGSATVTLRHNLAATGLGSVNPAGWQMFQVIPAATFDTTIANQILGMSVNGGAAAAWTINNVFAELWS